MSIDEECEIDSSRSDAEGVAVKMASQAVDTLKHERRKLLFESKREREFYRYADEAAVATQLSVAMTDTCVKILPAYPGAHQGWTAVVRCWKSGLCSGSQAILVAGSCSYGVLPAGSAEVGNTSGDAVLLRLTVCIRAR